jgi:pimeloyl-ACP methyl ester carboxylesterase
MRVSFLDLPPSRLRLLHFGGGDSLLIALHGFGDKAELFAPLAQVLGKKYTLVAFDLPFHGQTEWRENVFSKTDLARIIRQIMDAEGRERLSLMGFSFGGRLVMSLLPELKDHLDKIYLLSPDGINTKGMYMAENTPVWLRRQLYRTLQNPAWLLRITEIGHRYGLINDVLFQFIKRNVSRPERLKRSFLWWASLDSFLLRRHDVRAFLAASGLPTAIYLGTQDDVIKAEVFIALMQRLPNVHCTILDTGHRIVGEKLAQYLESDLLGST